VDHAGTKARGGRLEERAGREQQHRHRDRERQPAEEHVVRGVHPGGVARVDRAVEEHQVHGAGGCHAQADQRRAVFDAARVLNGRRVMQMGRIPQPVERARDGGQVRLAGRPRDLRHPLERFSRTSPTPRSAAGSFSTATRTPRSGRLRDTGACGAGPPGGIRRLGLHVLVVEVVETAAGDAGRFEGAVLALDEL